MNESDPLLETLAGLRTRVDKYGNLTARHEGMTGWIERYLKQGVRRLIQRHLDEQREINQAVLSALDQLAAASLSASPSPPPTTTLAGFLGLKPSSQYEMELAGRRQSVLEQLSGCSPEGATPAEMSGYVAEAALRFGATISMLKRYVANGTGGRLLEIGSNPYFLTLMLRDSFPELVCTGVNYFEGVYPARSTQTQSVTDPRSRLSEVMFFHADVEQHSLEALGTFSICLFCEVLEHLPFDPSWALHNIVSRLQPGGLLLLTTPNPARLENLEKMAGDHATFSDPISGYGIHGRHNREYSANELMDLITATGMTVLETRTVDVIPSPYSLDAEAKGYGAYHLIVAQLTGTPRLVRPAWLYRSFSPERLSSVQPLLPGN